MTIDYAQRYQEAILGMVSGILSEVAEEGLSGEHSFYLTFDTTAVGVELSPVLKEHHPESMTIVLQNQFWGLTLDEEALEVTLRFGGAPERLRIPWLSLISFVDPSAEFGIELARFPGASETKDTVPRAAGVQQRSGDAEIVHLDEFKKR